MEEMERAKEFERNRSSEERLHRTAERTDLILVKLNDFASRETLAKGNIRDLENRLEVLEERQVGTRSCIKSPKLSLVRAVGLHAPDYRLPTRDRCRAARCTGSDNSSTAATRSGTAR